MLVAMTLLSLLAAAAAAASINAASERAAFIDISVVTLRARPSEPPVDNTPTRTIPSDDDLTVPNVDMQTTLKLATTPHDQTQGLYGSTVTVLGYADGWYEIAIPSQPHHLKAHGCTGYIREEHLIFDDIFGELKTMLPFAMVNKPTVPLFSDARLTDSNMNVTFDTRLPVLADLRDMVIVAAPGDTTAFLHKDDVKVHSSPEAIPRPSGNDVVDTALLFLGTLYLHGGTSATGFDDSGLTHAIYSAHGVTIAREIFGQIDIGSYHGTYVADDALRPGDLLFYGDDAHGENTVDHVAIYAGDNQIIEASESAGLVQLVPMRMDGYRIAARVLG